MRKKGYERKTIRLRTCTVLFFAGILMGVCLVHWQETTSFAGIFSEYFLNQYASMEIDYHRMISYIGRYRVSQYILVVCCGILPLAAWMMNILIWSMGMIWGTMISVSLIRLGMKGVLICVAGVMPQLLFYIPAFGWILVWIWKQGNCRKRYIFLTMGGLFFLLFGILAESCINPLILQHILRKI